MAEAERTCDKCGKTFKSDGAWYAKHALKCDGSGRADAGKAVAPAADWTPPREEAGSGFGSSSEVEKEEIRRVA